MKVRGNVNCIAMVYWNFLKQSWYLQWFQRYKNMIAWFFKLIAIIITALIITSPNPLSHSFLSSLSRSSWILIVSLWWKGKGQWEEWLRTTTCFFSSPDSPVLWISLRVVLCWPAPPWGWNWAVLLVSLIPTGEQNVQREIEKRWVLVSRSIQEYFIWPLVLCALWFSHIVSWEPEGHYHYSKMFCWEPKGRYRHRLCTVIVPFWF